jgi:hypothetical protein
MPNGGTFASSASMKIWLTIGIVSILAFFAGRVTVHYSVPALVLGDLHLSCLNYQPPQQQNLENVRPFLEKATWINGRPYWKMPYDYILKDGRKFSIDGVTGLFVVDGTPGYYKIRTDDEVAFRNHFLSLPPNGAKN